MDNNDLLLIDNLYSVNFVILNLYKKLASYEIKYGVNSKKYNDIVKLLNISLCNEKMLYNSIANNIEKVSDILFYIASISKNDLGDSIFLTISKKDNVLIEKLC